MPCVGRVCSGQESSIKLVPRVPLLTHESNLAYISGWRFRQPVPERGS